MFLKRMIFYIIYSIKIIKERRRFVLYFIGFVLCYDCFALVDFYLNMKKRLNFGRFISLDIIDRSKLMLHNRYKLLHMSGCITENKEIKPGSLVLIRIH